MNWKGQLYGFVFGVGVAVLVGVAGSLAEIDSLGEISLAGIAVTVIRSAATAIVTLLGSKVPGVSAK